MVNENHFQFDRKSFFIFWKTIYGFKSCTLFSEIKFFVIACTFDIRLLEFNNCRSSESSRRRVWQHPATVAGCRQIRFRPKLAGILPDSGHGQNLVEYGQNG
jgi:hypothetical protein